MKWVDIMSYIPTFELGLWNAWIFTVFIIFIYTTPGNLINKNAMKNFYCFTMYFKNTPKNTRAQTGERPANQVQNTRKPIPRTKPKTATEYGIASLSRSSLACGLNTLLITLKRCRLIIHKLTKKKPRKAPTAWFFSSGKAVRIPPASLPRHPIIEANTFSPCLNR